MAWVLVLGGLANGREGAGTPVSCPKPNGTRALATRSLQKPDENPRHSLVLQTSTEPSLDCPSTRRGSIGLHSSRDNDIFQNKTLSG